MLCYHDSAVKRILKYSPFVILLSGFALRLYRLGANSLWYDETVSLYLAQSDVAELIRHTAGDIHPPFYYLLLHFWGRVAGWSEFSSAFLSLWFGVLLIAVVCRVAREWFASLRPLPWQGEGVGVVAALLVAISPYNVWYSQEVRMYTLGAALGLLSVYFLRRMLDQPKLFTRDFFAYVIATALGFYTLYYFIFLVVFQWVWVAYRVLRATTNNEQPITNHQLRTNPLATFLLSQLALVVLYLPWLPIAFRQATDPPVPPWREFVALPRVVLETMSALAFGQAVDPNVFGWIALLLLVSLLVLAWRRASISIFLLGYFLVPLTAIYLFSLWKPLYHVRYMFTYAPAFYILVAYALVNLVRKAGGAQQANAAPARLGLGALAAVGVGFLLVTGYSLNNFWRSPQYAKDDLRGAVNLIAERWRPGDIILVNAGYAYPALTYYFPEALARERLVNYQTLSPGAGEAANVGTPLLLETGSINGAKNLGWNDPRSDFYATDAAKTRAALDRVFADHPRVWMLRIYDTVVDPNGVIRAYFNEHATLLEDQVFSGESQARVQGFLTRPTRDLPPDATRVNKSLGERVELVGYQAGARTLERGAFFDVVLYWKLLQAVNHNYQVTLQVLNEKGENVAQEDEMPLSELLPMTRWQVVPQDNGNILYREPLRVKIPVTLAPGTYRTIVKLYEPRSGEVLGDIIELGNIQVH